MATMEFRCDKCGKLLRADAAGGERIACNHCGASVAVPAPAGVGPRPQVMGGARPLVAAAPPEPIAPQPHEGELDDMEGIDAGAMGAMAALMPWAISIVFHVGLLLIMTFFAFQLQQQLEEDEEDPIPVTAQKVIVPDHVRNEDLGTQTVNPNAKVIEEWSTSPGMPPPSASGSMMRSAGGGIAVIGIPSDSEGGLGPQFGNSTGKGTDSLGSGVSGMFGEGGFGQGANLFGNRGTSGGNVERVAFVVDNSGSMFNKFKYVQAELVRYISELDALQQFQVIFFSEGPPSELTIGGRGRMHMATAANKGEAGKWIGSIRCVSQSGKTDPTQAIERLFSTQGDDLPQLVYLLTDGIFPSETIDLIKKLNSGRKVCVSTIMFIDFNPEAERMLRKIAEENGGKYKFVSEEELGRY